MDDQPQSSAADGLDPGFFQAIVEAVPEAIIVAAPEGRITYLNPAAERLLGYEFSDVVGSNIVRLVPPDPDRRADPVKWLARWAAEPEPEQARHLVFQAKRKDGRKVAVEVRVTRAYVADGERFFISFRDVTQRRLDLIAAKADALRASRTLLLSEDAIVSCGADQKVAYFNPKAEAMFGYSADEALGLPLAQLLPPEARDRHAELLKAFGAGPSASRRMSERGEVRGLRRNGETFPLEASITKLEIGGTLLFTAQLRDVTDRKIAAARLQAQERRLRAVFDNAAGAIALLSPDGAVVEINAAALRLILGEADGVHGRALWDLAWGVQDAAAEPALKAAVRSAGRGVRATFRAQISDGEGVAPVGVVATPVAAAGGEIEFILVEGRTPTTPSP